MRLLTNFVSKSLTFTLSFQFPNCSIGMGQNQFTVQEVQVTAQED